MVANSLAFNIRRISGDSAQSPDDRVAVEEPLEIQLGYSTPAGRTATSISITMRTPGDNAELATGFLYSESIIRQAQEFNVSLIGFLRGDTFNIYAGEDRIT